MNVIHLNDIDSTNAYLLKNADRWQEVTLTTDYQSAGQGMGTNTWESENGKNLLFSILIHPTWLPVTQQYLLSMAEALALRETLAEYADDITIKWPNDIYWKDRKLSGTRIDLNLMGSAMQDMVIGTGINVNQRAFKSDAPNPVSLWQITHEEHSREEILQKILRRFEQNMETLRQGGAAEITKTYHQHLYRRDGMYEYQDSEGVFRAEIDHVEPSGLLVLRREDGTLSSYYFKEVSFQL